MSDKALDGFVLRDVIIGLGTWAWGDQLFWGYGNGYTQIDLEQAFEASLSCGIRFFDTAESYGQGESERLLGHFIRNCQQNEPANILVASKFIPYPWRLSRSSLIHALKASLKRIGIQRLDLYQIHMPFPPIPIRVWMEAMAEATEKNLIASVGVSNFDAQQMQTAYDTLTRSGISLASNQVEYNLLNRKVEKNGLLARCQELGIRLIAYSPLAMGVLTGKYTSSNPPRGLRAGKFSRKTLDAVQPLITILKRIGNDHGGKSAAQVALNWIICKGALPIPGAKKAQQVLHNAGALGWNLSSQDVIELDKVSDDVNTILKL